MTLESSNTAPQAVKLTYGDVTAELPVVAATSGRNAIDISKLTAKTGLTALDYGFVNTASTKSEITYIDGDEGVLRYRGYPIEQLAEHSTFLEVAYLLIYGELPTAEQMAKFDNEIRRHTLLHEDMKYYFEGLPHTAHPMAVLSGGIQALSTFYESSLSASSPDLIEVNTIRLLAKLPVLAAYAHRSPI
ncbi:citrate/2-methylcitrate synthase, partial [Canibacter oris]|nr:citrate synthase [Canibacter oris]